MNVQLERPREIHARKPVLTVLVGGFLGAGKTTALAALARSFLQEGRRVGFVTNDQAEALVDTAILRSLGQPVGEVAGGCFCCRFTDLLDSAQSLLDQEPDVLLCEAVGSCTDMTATVLLPLRYFYPEVFRLAPHTVVVDPDRLREREGGPASPFADEVSYILRKQLEEADAILLNKTDLLPPGEADALARSLAETYGKPALGVSALRGEGIDEWRRLLIGDTPSGSHALQDVDYDIYAQGEAVLGWLNATARLRGALGVDAGAFLRALMEGLQEECRRRGAVVAHVKAALTSDDHLSWANLTRTSGSPTYQGDLSVPLREATLLLNARVQIEPAALDDEARSAILGAAEAARGEAEILGLQAFSPGYPRPPYRMPALVQ